MQGAGAGGGTYQLAMALTGDTFQSDERTKALGLLEAANGLGKVLSPPILGSLIALISWQTPFFLSMAFWPSPPSLWGFGFFVPEKEGSRSKDTIAQYWQKLKDVFQKKSKASSIQLSCGHDRAVLAVWCA